MLKERLKEVLSPEAHEISLSGCDVIPNVSSEREEYLNIGGRRHAPVSMVLTPRQLPIYIKDRNMKFLRCMSAGGSIFRPSDRGPKLA